MHRSGLNHGLQRLALRDERKFAGPCPALPLLGCLQGDGRDELSPASRLWLLLELPQVWQGGIDLLHRSLLLGLQSADLRMRRQNMLGWHIMR